MRYDIRTAALDDLSEQRVRLAMPLLGAFNLQATLSAWDGTRCNLLIAPARDAYGERAIALAQQHGAAVIAIGESNDLQGIRYAPVHTTASALALLIRDALRGAQSVPMAPSGAGQQPYPDLCRLATPPLRGKNVVFQCNESIVALMPETGRAYALSHEDLMAAAQELASTGLDLIARDHIETAGLVSASLESFLAQTAYAASRQLPNFAESYFRLKSWPDLGASPALIGALKISKLLVGSAKNIEELRGNLGNMDPAELNACLWAFAAADVLQEVEAPSQPPQVIKSKPRMQAGLWSSLARRFGLVRA